MKERPVFEVIEVADDVPKQQPEAPTHLVSDRPARASDNAYVEAVTTTDPYSEGDVDAKLFEEIGSEVAHDRIGTQGTDPGRQELPNETQDADLAEDLRIGQIAEFAEHGETGMRSGALGASLRFRNLLSSVGRKGGLSFNTYDWDFAPYMLAMKRAIESHIYPPYAFTHMGLVSGTNLIRFSVMPNGRIRKLEILESDAHFSLDQTSLRAIELSVPFLPLPSDFPEEYLEVTAHFAYVIQGRD